MHFLSHPNGWKGQSSFVYTFHSIFGRYFAQESRGNFCHTPPAGKVGLPLFISLFIFNTIFVKVMQNSRGNFCHTQPVGRQERLVLLCLFFKSSFGWLFTLVKALIIPFHRLIKVTSSTFDYNG